MEHDLCDVNFDLLAKTRSTIEGILVSGRTDIWSTYGALRRASEILNRIFTHNFLVEREEELLKYLLERSRKVTGFDGTKSFNIHPLDPISLEEFIEEYCLLGFNTSSVIENCFLHPDHDVIEKIYTGTAILRSRPCLLCLKVCFTALEQCSLEILTSLNQTLANQNNFEQYLKEESDFELMNKEDDEKQVASSPGNEPASFPTSPYPKSSGNEHLGEQKDFDFDVYGKKKEVVTRKSSLKNEKEGKRKSIHQDVLMISALSAVMETNEDGLVWFDDADRKSLLSEPGEIARNRIARMREISRSEGSLFHEHGHIEMEGEIGREDKREDKSTNIKKEIFSDQEAKCEKEAEIQVDSRKQTNKDDVKSMDILGPVTLKRSSKVLTTPFKRGHSRSKSDQIGVSKSTVEVPDGEKGTQEDKLSTSAPNATTEDDRHQGYYYQPEDGYMFPKPYKGQSLISYLDSRSYDTGAELDKENAHFSICEALITAIEQMKCSKFFDSDSDDSDEEIKSWKEKIKEKKLRKRLLRLQGQRAFSDQSSSTATRSTSSFFSGSTFSTSQSSSAADEKVPQDNTPQKILSKSWENVSLSPQQNKNNVKHVQSSTSKPELSIKEDPELIPNSKPEDYSAEFVAKSLLKKFAGRKLPAASDLKWIVSEDQVPQTILPLPNAWPVSPDDALLNGSSLNDDDVNNMKNSRKASMPTRLRGNFEWAPPRPQLIFTAHQYVKRKVIVQKQHYRCAGCGLKVTPSLSKRFRYCHYLGKYFCTSCHQNQMMPIPSKIIEKWDFKQYPISDFARDFLTKVWKDPLFNLSAIDNNIYKKIKSLEITRELRLKLHYAKRFLKTCRHGESICNELLKLPQHVIDEVSMYSLEDFIQVKNGDLQNILKPMMTLSLKHIKDCQLCAVKGFVCEYCRDFDDILYPFELGKVASCPRCKTCYHKACFVPEKCPKCERMLARQRLLDTNSADN